MSLYWKPKVLGFLLERESKGYSPLSLVVSETGTGIPMGSGVTLEWDSTGRRGVTIWVVQTVTGPCVPVGHGWIGGT